MTFRIFLLSLSMLTCAALFAQNKVEYHTGYVLQWADFKGKAPKQSAYHALTNSGISFATATTANNDSLEISVLCYFDRSESWTVKEKQRPVLLDHERLHWDITEVYARQLRKALDESDLKMSELNAALGKLFNQFVAAQDKRQEAYDKETDHSKNESAQTRWQEEIAAELKALEPWAQPAIRIPLKK